MNAKGVALLFILVFIFTLVSVSVANLALLCTNITKSTSVPSAASASMSSQSVVLETTAGWLTSASAVRRGIPAGLTSGRHPLPLRPSNRYCLTFSYGPVPLRLHTPRLLSDGTNNFHTTDSVLDKTKLTSVHIPAMKPSFCRKLGGVWDNTFKFRRGHLCRQMDLAGEWEVLWREINAHIWLCLPDRARAQHLLCCVWAKLCEGLEPKALTWYYTADKAICEESFLKAAATFLLRDCRHCRLAFLSNLV